MPNLGTSITTPSVPCMPWTQAVQRPLPSSGCCGCFADQRCTLLDSATLAYIPAASVRYDSCLFRLELRFFTREIPRLGRRSAWGSGVALNFMSSTSSSLVSKHAQLWSTIWQPATHSLSIWQGRDRVFPEKGDHWLGSFFAAARQAGLNVPRHIAANEMADLSLHPRLVQARRHSLFPTSTKDAIATSGLPYDRKV